MPDLIPDREKHMLTYDLKSSNSPLYLTLYKAIKDDITSSILPPSFKLPSKRAMAQNNGVSIITVENAYALLLSEGYIYSKPRSGYFVSHLSFERKETKRDDKDDKKKTEREEKPLIDLSSNRTPSDLFPFDSWLKASKSVFSSSRDKLLENSPSQGVKELRESISKHLEEYRGLTVDPDNIIIGAGSEYLYQILILLLGRDKTYGIEDPGYGKIERIYSLNKVKLEYLPLDENGVNPDNLKDDDVDILHITPSHQYPTGIVMPVMRRLELLAWSLRKNGRYIIEDDYDSELRLEGKPIASFKSIDTEERVIYINTFSKTLSSTVRISYMVLPDALMNKYKKDFSFYSSTVPLFEQYTLLEFMRSGRMESHINRMRTYYRRKRDLFLNALKESPIKDKITIKGERAGVHFLLHINTEEDEASILSKARKEGIKLLTLSSFYHNAVPDIDRNTYIISYAPLSDDAIPLISDKLTLIFK